MKNGNHEQASAGNERAKRDLIEHGVLRVRQECPRCGSGDVRPVRRDKLRCRACGREWGLRKGSILEGTRISYQTFMNLLHLYADDVPANDAAGRLKIAYNTVQEVYSRIGRAATGLPPTPSYEQSEDDPEPKAPGVLRRPSACKKTIIFGIRSQNGRVSVEIVESPRYAEITTLPVPSMQRGNILFIDAHGEEYQGFIVFDTDRHGEEVVRIKARDGFPWSPLSGFWTFAGVAWKRRRGVKRERIPEFVLETTFRYNHRDEDLYPLLLAKIAETKYGK